MGAARNRRALSAALPQLAHWLRRASYTPRALAERLGIQVPDDVGPLNHAAAVERLRDDRSAVAALTRLFFLEQEVPNVRLCDAATRALLCTCGLLAKPGRQLRARLRVDAVGDQWLLSDLRFRAPDTGALGLPSGDPVYPPSSDSLLLRDAAALTLGGRVLDLCTGSGVLALSIAARASQVVAVDVSARAVAMTEANALLNGVVNIEVRLGDLYRPVASERFDTVLANPPFVPSPYRTAPAYHSGGPTGTRVLQRVVQGLSPVLRVGGRFMAVSHLALRGKQRVGDVLQPWSRSFPGRMLALVLESGSPVDLAAAQSMFALADGLSAYAAEVRHWAAYLHRHAIREVVLILLVGERAGRRGIDVIEAFQRTLPLPLSHPPRHHVEQWLC